MKLDELKQITTFEGIDEVFVTEDDISGELLVESRQWLKGRFPASIGFDRTNHGAGQDHAHIYGRKGNEVGAINFDGTASHGSRFKLSDQDADALRLKGFTIPPGNLVEWVFVGSWALLLG